ncbi:MAG: prolyl oligopeptidase family serine peptidase [Actinobacteria bacterium]|nr:prolyl oligopeptidase family serine peptidase [Actinomycetota bacterium]MSW77121.1 prolyl oligopeptidase family serine peptidase [Actinomycetota bacterium]MSX54801.1 prolyl oligopeptidase family serine peptidase [Actinomycetota bacterium]MSZ83011.1 prolyl oligopeptidase family serine peptidase [Actinomycetota bacterium]MTB17479.1 prolyl oligopeptidase family serine peptidase [Actinomycetota bacterium]
MGLEIAEERCVGGRDLTEPRLLPGVDALAYVRSAAGESVLVVHHFDGTPDTELATAPSIRAGRSMGGGAWWPTPDGSAVVYVGGDGNVWRQSLLGDAAEQLTNHGPERATSCVHVSPDGESAVYVIDQAEVWRVAFAGRDAARLDRGDADFCLDPWAGVDGSVRWMAWDVPAMPWECSRTVVRLSDGSQLEQRGIGAVQQARLLPDGHTTSVRDDTGWLNVWRGDAPALTEAHEHAGPTWGAGQTSYAWSPDGAAVAFTRNEGGFGRLCVLTPATGEVVEVARGVHGQLSWVGDRLAALRTGAVTPTQVVVYDTASWARATVAVGPVGEWAHNELVEPTLVEVDTPSGAVHARLYTADEPDGRLIVWLHGGPTDQWQVTFMPRLAYWRSRGWNILVPDHRGSTGHGREYQQALHGRWGDLDVADTIAAAHTAHARGWGEPGRTVVIGGSAGGFTALGAVAFEPQLFAAAVLLYPVTDLLDLAERSHRFERHYTDSLVGPLPEHEETYRVRSPVWHTDRLAHVPLLLLHGDADPVVPVEQSRVLAERTNAVGGRVELHVYEGEGHGFRQLPNQLDEYRRIADFLARHVPVASRS